MILKTKTKETTTRAYNFCAGPAAIPEPVLQKTKEELLNGRRLLECRRTHDELHDPERRARKERRVVAERRKPTS